MNNPFRYFNSSPGVIRPAMMMYVRYPLSLRQGEDILFERGIDIGHEAVRCWWNRCWLNNRADLPHDVTVPAIREKYTLSMLTIQRIIVE